MIYDIAIIGAGIAGAGLAAELAPHMKVLVLEAEDRPGYHSTGRSNALWHETYGGPDVAPLTSASREPLESGGFLKRRSAITLGRAGDFAALDTMAQGFEGASVTLERLNRARLEAIIPGIQRGWDHGLCEPESFDIDVAGYHGLLIGQARRSGADIALRARCLSIRRSRNQWSIETPAGVFQAAIICNAAGAWADEVAAMSGVKPIGITPYRRTIAQLRLGRRVDPNLPFLIDVGGTFYFRPEGADRVWLSPHDETSTPACDAAPEELDIAHAIDRFQRVVDWPIAAVEHSWAGLRSFAPDRLPVYGFATDCPAFFWCAGQGGFGIQTAPAASKLCGALILGAEPDSGGYTIKSDTYAPMRFV